MGRYLLCGKEARLPYEVEELDLCLYTIEELCYFLFHHPDLIGDDFIDSRLIGFIRNELELPEIADKIERFYSSPSDLDATVVMLLSEVGYYTDAEITEFKGRLVLRKRRNKPERLFYKAKRLYDEQRYMKAIRIFRPLFEDRNDVRITPEIRSKAAEYIADSYGHLYCFDRALEYLGFAYDESKQERLLKKMYDVSLLSGITLPEKYFKVVPESMIASWHEEYLNRELLIGNRVENSDMLKLFFRDKHEAEKELADYIDAEREKFRVMAE